jgi:hypothetical protein
MDCGAAVSHVAPKQSNKLLVPIIAGIVICAAVISIVAFEASKVYSIRQEKETAQMRRQLEEYLATPTTSDLLVNDTSDRTKGNYVYITGSVTNTSSTKTISYFEVGVKFYNSSGSVVDSDWTNDATDLKPGETRQFEIMHKKGVFSRYSVFVQEVR